MKSFTPPPDKSIGHRAAIFLALSEGQAVISNFPQAADCLSTVKVLRDLGAPIETESANGELSLSVTGCGPQRERLQSPAEALDCGNSGTTARLISALIASTPGLRALLTGDDSLRRRPMSRVTEPLRVMGAKIEGSSLPISIEGAALRGLEWLDTKSSAQVKSALLLAGLSAQSTTRYKAPLQSRDHTERMLAFLGCPVVTEGASVSCGASPLTARDIRIPGDPSGAAFLLGAAVVLPGAAVRAEGVCVNPTRLGFYRALKEMGASVSIETLHEQAGEPVGIISCRASQLSGVTLQREQVPSFIDELPLLAVLATQAHGETAVHGAEELRVKESDRIEAICENLTRMGAKIRALPDGFVVQGPTKLSGAKIRCFSDHRIAMSMKIASLLAQGQSSLDEPGVVSISYPSFFEDLGRLF